MPVIVRSHKLLRVDRSTSAIVLLTTTQTGVRSIGVARALSVQTEDDAGSEVALLIGVRSFGQAGNVTAGPFTQPAAPSNLRLIVARATQLDIAWDSGGTERFRVYYRKELNTRWILDNPVGVSFSITTYTLTELTPGTSWEISVTRWDPVLDVESTFDSRIIVSTL